MSEVDKHNHWDPIVGIFDDRNPLLSIKQAAQFLPQYPNYDIQKYVAKAIEKVREEEMKGKIASIPGMTESGAAAIWLYTLDGPLHRDLNGRLQMQDKEYLRCHYHPYLRVLLTAMKCLQSGGSLTLYHGVSHDVVSECEDKGMYEKEKKFVWWSFTSATPNIDRVKEFLSANGQHTIFQIHSCKGVDVSSFSSCESGVREYLLPPGTVLQSTGIVKSGEVTTVQCQDDGSGCELVL